MLVIAELNCRLLHTQKTDSGSVNLTLLNPTPATQWYKVCLCCIKTHESTNPSESGFLTKVMEYSMADISTTSWLVLDLIMGGCCARGQQHTGIRYVSVVSKLMNLPTLLRVVFTIATLLIPKRDGGSLHKQLTESISNCGRVLGSTPAIRWYRIGLEALNLYGAIGSWVIYNQEELD